MTNELKGLIELIQSYPTEYSAQEIVKVLYAETGDIVSTEQVKIWRESK